MTTIKLFKKVFHDPCEFWTSEDGMLLSLVIADSEGYEKRLREHWTFAREEFDPSRLKKRYAYREWVGHEYFDGNSGRRSGKVWRLCDEPTEFRVIEYELKIPR